MREYITNAHCPRCHKMLRLSPVTDYVFYCEECDEDFYGIEVNDIRGDFFEISPVMSYEEYQKSLPEIKKNFKDAIFIGFDDVMEVCDISFDDFPSSKRIKEIMKFFALEEK